MLRAEQCRKMSAEAAKKSLSPWATLLLSNFSKYLSARAKNTLPPPKNIIEILPAVLILGYTRAMLIEALVHSRSKTIYSVMLLCLTVGWCWKYFSPFRPGDNYVPFGWHLITLCKIWEHLYSINPCRTQWEFTLINTKGKTLIARPAQSETQTGQGLAKPGKG